MVPKYIEKWFKTRNWEIRPHQRQMIEAFKVRKSTLLMAPTGGGKTLSGFLASLIDIHQTKPKGLHTIYISPLKALTNDIERNLSKPVSEMNLSVRIDSRTGDTTASRRVRQRKNPPNILLTTPESLMLMLSYPDAREIFGELKCVIIDEVHSFAPTKRGDFTALALARLNYIAPNYLVFALSATVAEPAEFAKWLGDDVQVIQAKPGIKPNIKILEAENPIPYSGFMVSYAMKEVYDLIAKSGTSIVFVNTRSQSEFIFQMLWELNEQNLPIGIYHGSLSKENRAKAERMMAEGKLRSVVATAALELGIDWGQVDLVIQIGAPKGVSRLLQRIGRSNHRMDEPSEAVLVPANRFEVLEATSALNAIEAGKLDGEPFHPGSLDVIVQYIVNCICSEPSNPTTIFEQVKSTHPYRNIDKETFHKLFQFAIDGGYALKSYERYHRLTLDENGNYIPTSKMVIARHRQNIGVIVESAKIKIKRMHSRGGRVIGEVEESFIQQLTPGDSFMFAGQLLIFDRMRELTAEVRPGRGKEPKIPRYSGGNMPLSTFLAEGVRHILGDEKEWGNLPEQISILLKLQKKFSIIPDENRLLVESFPRQKIFYLVLYSFEGRLAHQTLGMLLTRRMERAGLKPLSFTVTDYALSITSARQVFEEHMEHLFSTEILLDELEEWITESPMMKRSFRKVATITGLTEQRYSGSKKTMRQMSFSTDLIYEVLLKYEPNHILLKVTRTDAERELLNLDRLSDLLKRFQHKLEFIALQRPSPLAIPVIYDVRTERIENASGAEELLAAVEAEKMAEAEMEAMFKEANLN